LPPDSWDEARGRAPDHGDPAVRAKAWAIALAVTAIAAAALTYSFQIAQAGKVIIVITLGGTYGVLAAATCWWLWRRGELKILTPSRGDITIGALLAAVLYALSIVGRMVICGRGSPREWWLVRLYTQIGEPKLTATIWVGTSVLCMAILAEIVWRGLVMQVLIEAHGTVRGWLASSVLCALAHVGTMFVLGHATTGFPALNPLVLLGAGLCGLIWGLVATRFERLGPSMFSHAVYAWLLVQFPLWKM